MDSDTDSSEDERDNGRQTLVRSKKRQRPVQRVPPMKSQKVSRQDYNDPPGPSERPSEPQSAKMLIFLQNGAQRLITFTLPKESCTLQEVLEQVNVPFSEDTHIQCMQNTSSEVDYFVSVGTTSRIEDLLENHPMLGGDIGSPNENGMSTPVPNTCPENSRHRPESPHTPRYVIGMLAVCKACGYTGLDFSRCERCKRVFTEKPKSVPARKRKVEQKKDPEKNKSSEGKILNLLKTTVKNLSNKTPAQEKNPRVRRPRGKKPDPGPGILTSSSDEDTSSSLLSDQLTMDSDNSQSGDDEINQNARFDEQQITELLTCLKEVINILFHSLKKDRKSRKELKKLFKKETKKAEVYNARNEIKKLCRTIRYIGLSRGSPAEVVAGTSNSHTESIPGTSRSCIEPVMTETSKNHIKMVESHTDALTGTSHSHTQVSGTSRSYTGAISGTSRCHTEAITVASRSHTEAVLRTSMNQMKTVADTSRNIIQAVAGNSRRHTEPTAGTCGSHTEATTPNSSIHTKSTAETSRRNAEAISVASRNQIEAVLGSSTSHTDATVSQTSINHRKRASETSTSHTDPTETETSKDHRKSVTETSTSHTDPTETETSKDHRKSVTETSTSHTDPTETETSKDHRKSVSKTSTSHTDPTETETSKDHRKSVTETSTSHTNPTVTQTSKDHRKSVTETYTSHTDPIVTDTMKDHRKSVTDTPASHTDPTVPETSKYHRKSVTETSTSHTDPTMTQTSKDHRKHVTKTSTSHTDPTETETSKDHRKSVTETSTSHTNPTVTQTSKDHRKSVTETSTSHTDPTMTDAIKDHRKSVTETSTSHTDPTVTDAIKDHRKSVTEISTSHTDPTVTDAIKDHRKSVTETSTSHTDPLVTDTMKDHRKSVTDTPASHTDPTVPETSKDYRKSVTETSTSHTDPTMTQTSKDHRKSVTETSTSHMDPTATETSKNPIIHTKPVLVTPKTHTQVETAGILKSRTKIRDPETSQTSFPGSTSASVFPETPRIHTQADTQTPGSRTKTVGARISSTHTNSIVTKTKKRRTQSASGILRNHAEPVVTLKTHTGAVLGTSRSHAEAIEISHTKDNSETPVRNIEAVNPINSLSKFEQDLAGSPNGQTKSVVHRNSSIHIEAVSGTSRNNTEALSSLTSAAGTVVPDATTINHKKGMLGIPKSNVGSVNPLDTLFETIRNHIDPILRGTTNDPTEVKLSNNSRNHKNLAVSETSDRQITNVNVNIRDDDVRHKEITNLQARKETKMKTSESDEMDNNTSAAKRNTKTSLKRNHANSNHDESKRSRLDNKCSGKKTIYNDNFEQHCTHHVIKHNKENYEHKIQKLHERQDDINKNEAQNGKVAKEKKSTDTKKRTSRSESTPNGHIEHPITNLTLTQVSDDISRKQADAKKRTAKRSNSTPNSHLEQANASTLAKITKTDKDNNKSYDERKRKSTENSAPNGRIADAEKAKKVEDDKKRKARKEKETQEMEKQDSTPKRQIGRASLAKITNTDNDNKSSDERKRKPSTENTAPNGRIEETIIISTFKIGDTQKAKKAEDDKKSKAQKEKGSQGMDKPDSTLKRKIEEANSTLTNMTADKENKSVYGNEKKTAGKDLASNLTNADTEKKNKPADVKTKIETRPNSITNERIEEFANSTLTKIIDTNKTNKPSDGKKRKASRSDSGPSKKTISYSTIDLTSDNDEDELKLPTTPIEECSPKPAEDDKEINDQRIIDINEDSCFYEPPEDTKSMTAIKKSSPKLADKDQVLKEEQVIDIDEDTCLYDPAQEKASDIITKSSPKSIKEGEILKDQQVIDISEDTCLYSPSEEKASVPIKETRPKPADNDQDLKYQEVIDISDDTCLYDVSEQEASVTTKKPRPRTETEICRLEGEKASVTNQELNKNIKENRTKLIKELEEKHAAELLATNVKKEQATINQMDSNAVVVSSFFRPQSNQKSNEGDHKSTEKKTTNTKQGLQDKSLKNRHDKVALKSKNPYEKPKNNAKKLNPEKVIPDITITTKAPDASNLLTNAQQPTQIASHSNSTEINSNVPVIVPELSISILPTPVTQANPNLSITSSTYSAIIPQSAQIARPDLSNATSSTTASDNRHTESRPEKPNPVTKGSKRPSSELGPSPKRDAAIKPRELKTNPTENEAQINQPPPDSEWISVPLTKLVSPKHSSSGHIGTVLKDNFDPASRKPTKSPESTSHKTSHVDLAPGSNRGDNNSNHVQSPQMNWYKPFPFVNLTPNQSPSRNLGSKAARYCKVSDEHSNPKASAKLNDPRKRSWQTPENDELVHKSTLQPSPTIPDSADQLPTSTQSSSITLAQPNQPLRPLLLTPRLQSTMMDSQKAPNVTRRTWHIPTEI